jgi:hypothetical protein
MRRPASAHQRTWGHLKRDCYQMPNTVFGSARCSLNTYPVRSWMQHGPRPPRFQYMSTKRLLAHTQNMHKGRMNYRRTRPRRRSVDTCDTSMSCCSYSSPDPGLAYQIAVHRPCNTIAPASATGYVTWYVYGTKPCPVDFTFLCASFVSFLRRLQRRIG